VQAVRLGTGITLALSALLLAARADAACNRPDLEFAVPPDAAEDVPPNAKLFARYRATAEYLDEDVTLTGPGGELTLTGEWSSPETLLSVSPKLEPGESYTVEWPALRGFSTASKGKGGSVSFTVGTTPDQEAPIFSGLSDVSWDVDRDRDDCTDSLEDRYVFDFELGEASDDGGRDSLMVVLFQTKGPDISSSSPVPVSVQRIPSEGQSMRLRTTLRAGEGDVCFAAVARDLTGQVSASGAKEVCVETVAPPFFEGCSAARRAPGRGALAFLSVLLLAAALRRSRR